MDFDTIIFQEEDHVARITLNRPEAMNTINLDMNDELNQALRYVSQNDGLRVLLIRATGRAFCAGADFRPSQVRAKQVGAGEAEDMAPAYDAVRKGKLLPEVIQLNLALQRLEKPTLAAVNGHAIGHGMDLAMSCDMRVGSPNARFVAAFIRMGLPPVTGGVWLLPRIVGLGRALEAVLTGDPIDGEEAYRIGLLNKLVPAEQLDEEAMKLARRLAAGAPTASRLAKLGIYKGLETDLETSLAFTTACGFIAQATEDHREGVQALAEKRPPVFHDR